MSFVLFILFFAILGGVVVTYSPLGLRFAGSNPAENIGFLRAVIIRSTTFFGGEVKTSAPYRKIYSILKIPTDMKEILSRKKTHRSFPRRVSPVLLLDVSADNCGRCLVNEL
jgi:hypothetical protein